MRKIFLLFFSLLLLTQGSAQNQPTETKNGDKLTLLVYARGISNTKGSVRFDENIVPNFRLNKWLRLEAGFRFGERPDEFKAYYHYKIELQTRSFRKTIRFLARISDNVIQYPLPSYRKTNEVFVAEAKFPLSKSWQLLAGGGYVFSARQDDDHPEALPTSKGTHNNYPAFKLTMRYLLPKGFLETTFGSYDTFNPYELDKPFLQESFEYELSGRCTAYNSFRYEYNQDLFTPFNYFLSFGLRFRVVQ